VIGSGRRRSLFAITLIFKPELEFRLP